ncbi:MAG: DUF1616 domain-containing protein [Thermoplasmatota archaeon]|nr:DUF1616 domain-containing protein [Candidatus Thermoplasmatota archaeon]MBU1914977.1 DUF1616 domain-containing protein [Candidatus Thermoplasmatota archaeon]
MAESERRTWRFHFEVRDRPYDLLACMVLALILITLVYLAPDNAVRQVLGLIFVLFLPGYAATAALFPENDQIDGIERVALSFGLSIAIVPLIGLALNFTPWGIRLDPILATVSAFIIGISLVGWYRRTRLPADERFAIVVNFEMDFRGMPLVDKILTIGIVVMLIASVVVLAWAITTPRVGERFTQLAILGPGGMATDYPRNLTVGQDATVLLTIKSFEHRAQNYTLMIVLTNSTDNSTVVSLYSIDWAQTHALAPHVGIAQNFTLQHLQFYNQTFDFDLTAPGTWKLQFLLYTEGQPLTQDAYREVHLWLNVA